LHPQLDSRKSWQAGRFGKESQPDREQCHKHGKQNGGKQAGDNAQNDLRNRIDEAQEWDLLGEEIDI
jgi:hypothetical protein